MKAEELKQEFISDYMPHIDKKATYPMEEEEQKVWLKRLDNLLRQYTEQESREVAVKWRTESVISDKDSYYEILEESYKLYDDWKSKQEEKP